MQDSEHFVPSGLMCRARREGFCAVVAVSTEDTSFVRIGRTAEPKAYLRELRKEYRSDWHCRRVVWFAGDVLANTVVIAVRKKLQGLKCPQVRSSFRVELDLLDDLIRSEAVNLNARAWTPAELAIRLQRLLNAEADRYGRGEI